MPKIASYSLLAALALIMAATLGGCAGLNKELEAEHGPILSVSGRISVRKIGRPLQVGSYTWNRGPGLNGWTESIKLTDERGLTFLAVSSDDTGTKVKYIGRTHKVTSLRSLLRSKLGIDLEPATLARWLENDYDGAKLPDEFELNDVRGEVVVRDAKGWPQQLLLRQDETLVLMSIRHEKKSVFSR